MSNTNNVIPYGQGLIAGICALGIGMLGAATVLSTPPFLILFLASGFVVNYTLPLIYRWLARRWVDKQLNDSSISHDKYINKLLNSTETDLSKLKSKYARNLGLSRIFWTGVLSLLISGALGAATYFIAALIPPPILAMGVGILMFGALAVITAINFYKGMKDVWARAQEKLAATKNGESLHPVVKWVVFPVFTLSCIAAGLLMGSMTFEGVNTTLASLAVGGFSFLGAMAGPLAWISFACVSLAMFSMTAYGFYDLFDKDIREKKMDMLRSFFTSTETYKKDLQTQWTAVLKNINDTKSKFIDGQENTALQDELNKLYSEKDSIYHRYTVYQQPWFNTLYKVISFIVFGVCLAGMLMHLARGYQGMDAVFQSKAIGFSHTLARGLATGVMYLSMLSETLFTATIVGSTMNEEALLGTHSHQYEDHLVKQQSTPEKAHGYFFQTSRGMHFMFEGLLGLFGADGHGAEHGHGARTGMPFADNPRTQPFLGASMGVMAGLEKCEVERELVTFAYTKAGDIDHIHNAQERQADLLLPRLNLGKISS